VDIVGRAIQSWAPGEAAARRIDTPTLVTSIGLGAGGDFVVGLQKSVTRWDGAATFETLAEIEPDLPGNRLNEGVVGPDGAFWVGTMQNNIAADGAPQDITASTGRLYRVSPDGSVEGLSEDRFGITNTLVWIGGRLITADTLRNELYSYRIAPESGRLDDKQTILAGFARGAPDGSCLDAEGFVWTCRVAGGACLIRYAPDGTLDRVVELPCTWPTSCTFGGPEFDILYVTSARFTMSSAHLAAAPHEGGLFSLDVGVRGRPAHRFGSVETRGR
jgi:sugar lactone lactonase YvrE